MPIHLLWGDDEAARSRAVEALVAERTDPAWQSINLARLDGNDAAQASQALEEARTPPFGGGDRVCLGKALAELEIRLMAVGLLRQCQLQLVPNQDLSLALIPSPSPRDGLLVVAAPGPL